MSADRYYELWSLHPGNLIDATHDELSMRGLVRELLDDLDWKAENLALGIYPGSDDRAAPEAMLEGPALRQWLEEERDLVKSVD